MDNSIQPIVEQAPRFRQVADELRETMLANLVMIGEIPAPTFQEDARVQYILQRFTECGMEQCSSDEQGNGMACLAGTEPSRTILLTAPADTFVEDKEDVSIEVRQDRVAGPFVGDNSIALAALATLPTLLERLGIRLKANLVFLASAKTLNRGNLEGLRFFLSNTAWPIHYGLCVESVQLGRLNHNCLGMRRGEIVCCLPDDYNWMQFGKNGSIIPINEVITQISQIPLPQRPLTSIVLGSIEGGISYHNIARETTLRFEMRSEDPAILNRLEEQIHEIVMSVASRTGLEVSLDIFTRREPGGIPISHPLVRVSRAMLEKLGITPMIYSTTSALSAFSVQKIPAVTLGITTGERSSDLDEIKEWAGIAPMSAGLAQLVGVLLAMDGGCCDDVQ